MHSLNGSLVLLALLLTIGCPSGVSGVRVKQLSDPKSSDSRVKDACDALIALGPKGAGASDAVPSLITLLQDPKRAAIRPKLVAALTTLGPAAPELAITGIRALLQDHTQGLVNRMKLTVALSKLGPPASAEAVTQLRSLLVDADLSKITVRDEFYSAVEEVGAGPGGAELCTFVTSYLVDDEDRVAELIWKLDEQAFAKALESTNEALAVAAAKQLSKPKGAFAVPALIKALQDKRPAVRLASAEALRGIGAEKAATAGPALRKLASKDPDMSVRVCAIGAAAHLTGWEEGQGLLLGILKSGAARPKGYSGNPLPAARELVRLGGGQKSIEPLLAILASEPDYSFRVEAAEILGEVGSADDAKVIEGLTAGTKVPDNTSNGNTNMRDRVREAAKNALAKLNSKQGS